LVPHRRGMCEPGTEAVGVAGTVILSSGDIMAAMTTVLLVEDDPGARQGLELALRGLGYGVRATGTGEAALRDVRDAMVDVVVLDVMLPGVDGFEVCRRLRRHSDVPVIILTARSDDFDIVGGLEAGADDYVVKPAEPRVLDARIRAVLRRLTRVGSPAETHGDLVIDRGSLVVRRAGREVSLTPTELRLLLVLSGSPRQVFSREQLLELVWEHDYLGDSRLVDACVQRLRAKVESDTSEPRYIQTVRGFGYRFGPV
jgi:two-component system, OmpR family, response regulator MtrA